MIIDVTGIELLPGNNGDDCMGNGEHFDERGHLIECCCDECDFLKCCMPNSTMNCEDCPVYFCPRNKQGGDLLMP